jgi:hypothetical protein
MMMNFKTRKREREGKEFRRGERRNNNHHERGLWFVDRSIFKRLMQRYYILVYSI